MKSITMTAAELINKHLDYDKLKSTHEIGESLINAYGKAEQDLMAYVGKQAKSAGTIAELVNCFYYTCYSFDALGKRADLLEEKLIGPQKTPAIALDRAVHKDIDRYSNEWIGFESLPLTKVGDGLLHDWYQPDITDWRALAAMPLLDYLMKGNYESLKLGEMLSDLTYGTCLSPLLKSSWCKRSLVGYYDTGFVYRLDIPNKAFISLFSSVLQKILDRDTTMDALQIREYMHQMLLKGWSDNHIHDPITLYADIEKIIDKHNSRDIITSDFVDSLATYEIFALRKSYDKNFVGYAVDYKGLKALASMLKDLGLDNLQGASHFISMIEGVVN